MGNTAKEKQEGKTEQNQKVKSMVRKTWYDTIRRSLEKLDWIMSPAFLNILTSVIIPIILVTFDLTKQNVFANWSNRIINKFWGVPLLTSSIPIYVTNFTKILPLYQSDRNWVEEENKKLVKATFGLSLFLMITASIILGKGPYTRHHWMMLFIIQVLFYIVALALMLVVDKLVQSERTNQETKRTTQSTEGTKNMIISSTEKAPNEDAQDAEISEAIENSKTIHEEE